MITEGTDAVAGSYTTGQLSSLDFSTAGSAATSGTFTAASAFASADFSTDQVSFTVDGTTVTLNASYTDQDGVAETSDALVNDATVYSTLTRTGTQESWSFSGVTENGVVEFTQKVTASGQYQAEVTNITHGDYGYTPEMDVDNPDFYSVPE